MNIRKNAMEKKMGDGIEPPFLGHEPNELNQFTQPHQKMINQYLQKKANIVRPTRQLVVDQLPFNSIVTT